MTASLLAVIFVGGVLASAFTAYLVNAASLTAPLRERAIAALNGPAHETYEAQLDDYRERVQTALAADQPLPDDPPRPPDDVFAVRLITCRSCVGTWTSLPVVVLARLALASPHPPMWTEIPLRPLDLLIGLGWWAATAYAVHWLATHEGD